jgi:hypothetical protein
VFRYIDNTINKGALATFKHKFGRKYKQYKTELRNLANMPIRHKDYTTKTFAIKHEGKYYGITKAFITGSQWEKTCFNQDITPYTEDGRRLYLAQSKGKKRLPLSRPEFEEVANIRPMDSSTANFEYYMNMGYSYNRDKGKCRICKKTLKTWERNCIYKNRELPLDKINKVSNLVWLCAKCYQYVSRTKMPPVLDSNIIKKVRKLQLS